MTPVKARDRIKRPAGGLVMGAVLSSLVFAAAAGEPAAGSATVAAEQVFRITVAVKDGRHPYYGVGDRNGFVVDDAPGGELILTRGRSYVFRVDTGVQHDFYFSTSPTGWGAGTVTDGVRGQFVYRGDVLFAPTDGTPAIVYYQCRNHKNMGGQIRVVNEGERVEQTGTPTGEAPRTRPVARKAAVSARQFEQKLGFAESLINDSETARRVAASDDAQARDLLAEAREQATKARHLLDAEDLEQAALATDQALGLMTRASRLAPPENAGVDHQGRYRALSEAVDGYQATYERERERMVEKKGELANTLDMQAFRALKEEAQQLAEDGRYAEANARLAEAQRRVTGALSVLLDAETVVFERKFTTAKEEYEWELARFTSYEELIPQAVEQRRPSEQALGLMNRLLDKGRSARSDAEALAAAGDHESAILAIQAATEHFRRALQIIGVQ